MQNIQTSGTLEIILLFTGNFVLICIIFYLDHSALHTVVSATTVLVSCGYDFSFFFFFYTLYGCSIVWKEKSLSFTHIFLIIIFSQQRDSIITAPGSETVLDGETTDIFIHLLSPLRFCVFSSLLVPLPTSFCVSSRYKIILKITQSF